MKDDELKSLLRANAVETKISPAADFWAQFMENAAEAERQPAQTRGFRMITWRRPTTRRLFYPFLTSAASLAACALVYFTVQNTPPDSQQPLKSFEIGTGLRNNGAIVITDTPTDATILWVMTEET